MMAVLGDDAKKNLQEFLCTIANPNLFTQSAKLSNSLNKATPFSAICVA
jgi:hypothetical protein